MKFLKLVTCCGPCRLGTEEKRLLVVQEPRRRAGRRRGRVRGSLRRGREWRPSLSSISEDSVLVAERINNFEGRLKGKVSSITQGHQHDSPNFHHLRGGPLSAIVPAFSPTPFLC